MTTSKIAAYRKALSDKIELVRLLELRYSQLENDLAAAKRREEMHREAEGKQVGELIRLRAELKQAQECAHNWFTVFEVVSKLVK